MFTSSEAIFELKRSRLSYRLLFALMLWCLYGAWDLGVGIERLAFLGVFALCVFIIARYCPIETVHTIIYRPSGWTLLLPKKVNFYPQAEILFSLGLWVVLRFKGAHHQRKVILFHDALDETQLKKLLVCIHLSEHQEFA